MSAWGIQGALALFAGALAVGCAGMATALFRVFPRCAGWIVAALVGLAGGFALSWSRGRK